MDNYNTAIYIRDKMLENANPIAIYLFGSIKDKENGECYWDYFSYEFIEFVDGVTNSIIEVIKNKQFELTTESIMWLIDWESTGFTCRKHPHENKGDIENLVKEILDFIKTMGVEN